MLNCNIFKCHNFKNYKFVSADLFTKGYITLLTLNVKNTLFELAELYVTFLIMAITLNWQDDIIQSSSAFISLQQIAPISFVCLFQLFGFKKIPSLHFEHDFKMPFIEEKTQFFGRRQLFYRVVGPTHMALLTIHSRVKFDKVK